jgi:HSP20 family protein
MRLIPYVRRHETPARIWPEISSSLDEFFGDPFFSSVARSNDRWLPAVDILEKDIDLKLEGNVLTLKGEKKQEHKEDHNNYHRMESFYGLFTRSFTLPETADRDQIKADFKNGILTVTIPQKPEVRPREIPVKTN